MYGLLGLGEKTYESTEKEIGRAYKLMALKYHPDKIGREVKQQDKDHWLKLQTAYETLIDPVKKRKYDSSLPFDDTIPVLDDIIGEKFYAELSKVFQRNSMWSKKKNVPDLGDADTPIATVWKFYNFWNTFETWREFSQYDEYNTDEASDRYERRYMEHENKRAQKKHDKTERSRLIKLVELAYNNDPRV